MKGSLCGSVHIDSGNSCGKAALKEPLRVSGTAFTLQFGVEEMFETVGGPLERLGSDAIVPVSFIILSASVDLDVLT